jgi:putative nucleotidyltransferase with HDIG domain
MGQNTAHRAGKSNAEYGELLEKVKDIPTLPAVAMRVNDLINDPHSTSSDIAEVLKKDQSLTAQVLRLVNSSYYSIPGGVTDVQRALAFLGFNTVAQLVLGVSVFSVFKKLDDESDFTMLDFWKHALGTAVASEVLAKRLKFSKPEEAFTCGLLHDIGKLVLHEIDPDRLKTVFQEARKNKKSFIEIEREWDLPGHSFLGEMIATRWGLPQVIRQTIRYHHTNVSEMSSILGSSKTMIHVVRLANTLCVKNHWGKSGDYSAGEILPEMVQALNLRIDDIPAVEAQIRLGMDAAGGLLSVYR